MWSKLVKGQCHPKHVKPIYVAIRKCINQIFSCTTSHRVKHLIGQIFKINKLLFPWQLLFIWISQVSCYARHLSCLFVSRISQNVMDTFIRNLVDKLGVWQGQIYYILVMIQIQILDVFFKSDSSPLRDWAKKDI